MYYPAYWQFRLAREAGKELDKSRSGRLVLNLIGGAVVMLAITAKWLCALILVCFVLALFGINPG